MCVTGRIGLGLFFYFRESLGTTVLALRSYIKYHCTFKSSGNQMPHSHFLTPLTPGREETWEKK